MDVLELDLSALGWLGTLLLFIIFCKLMFILTNNTHTILQVCHFEDNFTGPLQKWSAFSVVKVNPRYLTELNHFFAMLCSLLCLLVQTHYLDQQCFSNVFSTSPPWFQDSFLVPLSQYTHVSFFFQSENYNIKHKYSICEMMSLWFSMYLNYCNRFWLNQHVTTIMIFSTIIVTPHPHIKVSTGAAHFGKH